MKYLIQGQGEISLTDSNYITEGGEGKIYGKGNVIYKIYEDPLKMIPYGKIQELKPLSIKDNILIPQNIILTLKGVSIGFTMKWVQKTVPICKLFTNDFRDKFKITPDMIYALVERMQTDTQFIHENKCLIVDYNEMNLLVDDKTFRIPYFIDTNGYQTSKFPATAIMPSIRDWHSKTFTELTDWFSFAILACQLFIGIHPYKGSFPNYSKKDLEKRMKENASIFNKVATVPSSTRDFSYIPPAYMDWFIKLFEKGERIPPPLIASLLKIISVKTTLIQSTDNFIINFVQDYIDDIIDYWYVNYPICITKEAIWLGKAQYKTKLKDPGVILLPKSMEPIMINLESDLLSLSYLKDNEKIPCTIQASQKMIVGNSLFIMNDNKFSEVRIEELGDKVITMIGTQWNCLPNASQMFDGVVYQDILGMPYLMIPYRDPYGRTCCSVSQVKELKGYKILDAKQTRGVVFMIGFKNSHYDKIILKFDDTYSTYNLRIIDDIGIGHINFIVMDNGIVVSINEDDSIEIFSKNISNSSIKIIKDPDINSNMTLYRDGARVLFSNKNKLYQISMK